MNNYPNYQYISNRIMQLHIQGFTLQQIKSMMSIQLTIQQISNMIKDYEYQN